ncbi:hypothetical protein [Microlunatus parietis]|uniref:Uncharacterized protein n=1 Tax=Microlunatus parietis TaxID=682979 RepID=A0A7Y9I6F4_9ACTN|nr:hypothetical protein [Microlunatus parietis]NYE71007.1 hypothetical protein [Microlunatus parietis]
MARARGSRAGLIVLAAALIGLFLLIIPPTYSSDVNRMELSCGVPLLFDEDVVTRAARQHRAGTDTARLIGAECHERVTGRISGAVLAGLVAVGTLGLITIVQGRRRTDGMPNATDG